MISKFFHREPASQTPSGDRRHLAGERDAFPCGRFGHSPRGDPLFSLIGRGRITAYDSASEYRGKSIRPAIAIRVCYHYQVGGVGYAGSEYSHASSSIGPSHDSDQKAIAEYLLDPGFAKWQIGQPVAVYYDPQDPADAVLKTGAAGLGRALLGIGILIAAIGVREFHVITRLRASGSARSAPLA